MMQLFCTKAQTGLGRRAGASWALSELFLSFPEEPARASFFPSLHVEASQSRHRKDSVLVF